MLIVFSEMKKFLVILPIWAKQYFILEIRLISFVVLPNFMDKFLEFGK